MKTLRYLTLFILIATFSLSSCTSEYKTADLLGRWEVASAERDGKPTESLTGIFFEFKDEGKITTNFNLEGTEVNADFTLTGNTVDQQGTVANSYLIDKLEGKEMIMRTTQMNRSFKLFLEKK